MLEKEFSYRTLTVAGRESPYKAIIADGTSQLSQILESLSQNQNSKINNILLTVGGNEIALIKVDMANQPMHVWYLGLQGRAALATAKQAIQNFIQSKGGDESQFTDLFNLKLSLENNLSQTQLAPLPLPAERLEFGFKSLENITPQPKMVAGLPQEAITKVSNSLHAFFGNKPKTTSTIAAEADKKIEVSKHRK